MNAAPHKSIQSKTGPHLRLVTGKMDLLDTDIVSFCAPYPSVCELAFTLADHGHIYLGHVVTLSDYTITDLADGQKELTRQLRQLIQRAGFDLGMELEDWVQPGHDTDEDID